jgi:hypothetical protein
MNDTETSLVAMDSGLAILPPTMKKCCSLVVVCYVNIVLFCKRNI